MTKTAVVTGAGSGVGRGAAQAMLGAGYRVALLGRRAGALAETGAGFEGALVIPCDVSDPAAVERAFAKVVSVFGRIDVLFNNAGIFSAGRTIDETPVEDWLRMVNVNLNGAFFCARAAFAAMRAQVPMGGRIINNGSISAHAPRPGSAPYTTTKHAITGLTKTLALDGRAFDIACSQIDIGNALTEMAMPMTKGVKQANGSVGIEPTMDPDRVAEAVLYMAELPLDTNILFMTIMATKMPFVGRG